jgi:hypothetical protein
VTPEELAAYIVECLEDQGVYVEDGNGLDEVQICGWVDLKQVAVEILARIDKGR